MYQKFCTQCGSSLSQNTRFCGQCGAKVESAESLSPLLDAAPAAIANESCKRPCTKPKARRGFIPNLITKSLALALAVFTLVMAFMPLISCPIDDAMENFGVNDVFFDDAALTLNVFQITTLCLDSFFKLSPDELKDSELYGNLEDSVRELFKISAIDYDDMSAREKQIVKSVLIHSLRLSLRSNETALDPAFYIGATCALLYVCFATAFFVLALLSFLGVFNIAGLGSKRLERALYAMLTFLPINSMITYAALSFGFGQSINIAPALLLPIILSLVVILWISIARVIFDKVRYTAGSLVRRAFALSLSVAIFFLAFAPVVNCHFKGVFANSDKQRTMTVSMNAAAFGAFIYTSEAMDALDEVHGLGMQETIVDLEDILETIYTLSHRDGDNYVAVSGNSTMASHLLAAAGMHKASFVFTLIPVVLLGMLTCALLIIQANLSFFAYGANDAKKAFLSKILMLCFASLALILVIIFLVSISLTYKHYLDGQYQTLISAAFVILMLFNVGAACVPVKSHLFSPAPPAPSALPLEDNAASDEQTV